MQFKAVLKQVNYLINYVFERFFFFWKWGISDIPEFEVDKT